MRYDADLKKINSTKCQQTLKNVAGGQTASAVYCLRVAHPPPPTSCLVFDCCQSNSRSKQPLSGGVPPLRIVEHMD